MIPWEYFTERVLHVLISLPSSFLSFLLQMPKKKLRVRVIEHWIQTAKECFNIGNFNSLMAIIMAFNMSPLERLKKTVESNKT